MNRYALLLLSFSALLIYGIGCAKTGSDVVKTAKGETEIRIYEVFGMDCPGCHGGLNKLVEKISGIQQAESNWKEKRLKVVLLRGTQLNDEDIYDAIRRANFTPGKRIK